MRKEMQIKLGKKTVYTCTWRSIFYTLCFFLLCVIDQRVKTGSGLDGVVETFQNLTGAAVAALIISNYRWRDFTAHKAPYLILTALSVAGGAIALVYGGGHAVFFNSFCVAVLDVVLFCFIAMHTFISVVIEKKRPALNKGFGIVWAVMMLLMICSRSDSMWPFCYLVMFGCLYLTDFTQKEREDQLQGMLNGIILGFFILQGLCFVFRPYDRERYLGFYSNSNMNAYFYVEVLAAVLCKILYVHKRETGKAIRVFYWLGSGVVLAFLFMSIGRSAWVAAFFIILIALWALNRIVREKRFWRHGGIMLLCACLMFPVCFCAVRYIPPVFHHPVWFWGEYSVDKVHSFDTSDSWKYVNLDDFMKAALGRVTDSIRNLWEYTGRKLTGGKAGTAEAPSLDTEEPLPEGWQPEGLPASAEASAGAADLEPQADNIVIEGAQEQEQGSKEQEPVGNKGAVLEVGQEADSFLTRKTIYVHYAKNLNWRGHKEDEQGFQLTPLYHVGHAHNIFLQYGTDFGIPVMVLFAALVVWGALRLRSAFLETGDWGEAAYLLYLLIPVLFGMFEYSWGTGGLGIAMLFFALGAAMRENDPSGDDKKGVKREYV